MEEILLNFAQESITHCLKKSTEFWMDKQSYFKLDQHIVVNNPFMGHLLDQNYVDLLGRTYTQQTHYDSFIYAICLYKHDNLKSCSECLTKLLSQIPSHQKPFISAIHYYLGLCQPESIKHYLVQAFEIWPGNYDAFYHLLHFSVIPSQEKTHLAHIISQIKDDVVKDLYWCQLASSGPILLDNITTNMLDENDEDDSDANYTPSSESNSMTNTVSEVPITLNEVQELVSELQFTLNTRCIQLHLKQFELVKSNHHILFYEGVRHFNFYCFHNCISYMQLILKSNPAHQQAQLYYIKSLMFLQDVDTLYQVSKQLKQGCLLLIPKENKKEFNHLFQNNEPIIQYTSECYTSDMTSFASGCYKLVLREFDQAILDFQSCLQQNSLFFDAHYCLGLAHSFLSNFDQSIYEFSCFKKCCPESYVSFLFIGSRYLFQRKLKIAESFLLESLQRAVPEKLPMRRIIHKLAKIQIPQSLNSGIYGNSIPIHLEDNKMDANDDIQDIISFITPKTYVDPCLLLSLAYLYKLQKKYSVALLYFENILKQLITRPSIGNIECEVERVGLTFTTKWELTGVQMSSILVQLIQFSFLNMADIYISTNEIELARYY